MASETHKNGTSKTNERYVRRLQDYKENFFTFADGHAATRTMNTLNCGLNTYKDELHQVILTWISAYGKLPWSDVSDDYGRHNKASAEDIEKIRRETDLDVI